MMNASEKWQKIRDYASVMRVDHWLKNVFFISGAVFAFFLAHVPFTMLIARNLVLTFLVFGFVASVNYILNEIVDSPFDKLHPVKKFRAVPSNKVKIPILYAMQVVLLGVALLSAYLLLPRAVLYVSISFFISGLVYNVRPIRLKDVPILDVVTESVNNSIRFLAGWYVITSAIPPVYLLVSFWALGAFWMAGKRYGELLFLQEQKSDFAGYRKSLGYYTPKKLLYLIGSSCAVCFIAYGAAAFQSPKLFVVLPFIVIYFAWYYRMILRNDIIVREPETFFKRPFFLAYNFFLSAIVFIVLFLWK